MKIISLLTFLFCLGAFVAGAAHADEIDETPGIATPMTAEKMVTAYYNRCLGEVFQDLAPETREEFCACTSAHIKLASQQDALRETDLENLATGKGKPVDPVQLALKVMAPCLAAPMEELEYNTCMGDISQAHYYKTNDAYNGACHCVASGISQFIGNYGGDLMALLVKMNTDYAKDPTSSMRESAQYVQERGKLHNDCLNKYTDH